MKLIGYLIFLFALIVFSGGMMGYIQAHSLASLITSTLSSICLFIAAFYTIKKQNIGLYLASFVILALNLFFVYRFLHTWQFMPAGLMVILSTIFGCLTISKLTKIIKSGY